MKKFNKKIGDYGEFLSAIYLKNKNHKIISRNFRCKFGEIDIITKTKDNFICFIEVKSRYNTKYGRPCESITTKKINRIKKIAKYYIVSNNLYNFNFRFDVIEILFDYNNTYSITLIKNAF